MLRSFLLLLGVTLLFSCAPPPLPRIPVTPRAAALAPATPVASATPTQTVTPSVVPTHARPATVRAAPSATRMPIPPSPTRATAVPNVLLMEERFRPTQAPGELLPDLQVLAPADLVIEFTPKQERLLRFTTYIFNAGDGTLEVLGRSDIVSERTLVTQHIYRLDGTYSEHAAGIYIFHQAHNHWHFENFATYALWSLTPEGKLNRPVAVLDKVSYCLRDTGRSWLPNAAAGQLYTNCEANLQGISNGWIDSYTWDLPGQSIDITDLSDGAYALQFVVDPSERLIERDDSNNTGMIYLVLKENTVTPMERGQVVQYLDTEQ